MKSSPHWTDMTEEELSKDLEQLELRGFRIVELSAVKELLRRYTQLKLRYSNVEKSRDEYHDSYWDLKKQFENKKTECERLDILVSEYREVTWNSRNF